MQNGVTATLTMTAFDCNRTIEVHGTLGSLRGGEPWQDAGAPELWFRDHRTGTIESVPVLEASAEGYAGHGGGDFGLANALDSLMRGPDAIAPGLDGLAGHRLAYLAEKSRLNGGIPEVI
jgi:predicted dehydrogenase